MERLRDSMEAAIKERWNEPAAPPTRRVPLEPVADALAKSVQTDEAKTRPVIPPPEKPESPSVNPPAEKPTVSRQTLARHRLVAGLADSSEREAYCLLQAAVLDGIAADGKRVIGIAGLRSGSGATLTAVNLALSLAIDAQRSVLLIDLNLGAPKVHQLFDATPKAGIESCLFNAAAVGDVLYRPGIDNVKIVPSIGGCKTIVQVLRSRHLRDLFDSIVTGYPDDIVLVDYSALENADDVRALESLVDGVLLVIENGVTKERDYRFVLESIGERKLLGTVINKVPI